ncbi:hypothetical protein ES702_06452 [subsurface metagenome]
MDDLKIEMMWNSVFDRAYYMLRQLGVSQCQAKIIIYRAMQITLEGKSDCDFVDLKDFTRNLTDLIRYKFN